MEKEKTNPIKKSKKDASSDKEPATLSGENKGGNILRKINTEIRRRSDDFKEKKESKYCCYEG